MVSLPACLCSFEYELSRCVFLVLFLSGMSPDRNYMDRISLFRHSYVNHYHVDFSNNPLKEVPTISLTVEHVKENNTPLKLSMF